MTDRFPCYFRPAVRLGPQQAPHLINTLPSGCPSSQAGANPTAEKPDHCSYSSKPFPLTQARPPGHGFCVCMCLWVCVMYVHHVYAWCTRRPEEGIKSLETGVTNGCQPPEGCWEPNPGPLQEQPALLGLNHLSSPQQLVWYFVSLIVPQTNK